MKLPSIGILGGGFVGSATCEAFKHYTDCKLYDISPARSVHNYYEVLAQDILFVAVPTPMKKDGSVDASIVDSVLAQLKNALQTHKKPVILKSTLPPKDLVAMSEHYSPTIHLIYSPEFLTERTALLDFQQTNRLIFGDHYPEGQQNFEAVDTLNQNVLMITALFEGRFPKVPIYWCSMEEASLIKYGTNVFFAVVLSFWNELALIAESYGLEPNEVAGMIMLDQRIGRSHFQVPGHDGDRGFGGQCLVPETKIITREGLKLLKDVTLHDEVYDGQSFTKVTLIGHRKVNDIVELKSRGIYLRGSKDHIHFKVDNNKIVPVLLQDIKPNDMVYMPNPLLPTGDFVVNLGDKPSGYVKWWPEKLTITPQLARILGLYLAKGYSGVYLSKKTQKKSYVIQWSFGEKEKYLADETIDALKNIGLHATKKLMISNETTFGPSRTWSVRLRSAGFIRLIEILGLGKDAFSKNCPLLPESLALPLIGGWLDGDGSKDNNSITGFSRSQNLIFSIHTMLMGCGLFPLITKNGQQLNLSMRDDVEKISSYLFRINTNFQYVRNFSYASPTSSPFLNGWISQVTSIVTQKEESLVISLETKSHKYIANGMLTHNCFPKDINGYMHIAREQNVAPFMARAAWETNNKVRNNRNWEKDLGRAVTVDYNDDEEK